MNKLPIEVRVWDLPTRLFHWLLVASITTSVLTGFFDGILGASTIDWHQRSGYLAIGLIAFRLVWGLVGGTYARFASFLKGPGAVLRSIRSLVGQGMSPEVPALGHTALGGWSVVVMLAAVALQAVTGLFISLEDYGFEAPLAKHVSRAVSDRMNAIHEWGVWVILALVALHLAAILFYAIVKKTNLVTAMLSGFRRVPSVKPEDASQGGNIFLGLAVAGAVAYGVWWLVTKA
jgi:cytochrome b